MWLTVLQVLAVWVLIGLLAAIAFGKAANPNRKNEEGN